MSSELPTSLLDPHHDSEKHPCLTLRPARLTTPPQGSRESTHKSFDAVTQSNHSYETSQAHTHKRTPPSIDGYDLSLERHAAREEFDIARVQVGRCEYGNVRGIIGFLAIGQQKLIHLICDTVGKQKSPVGNARETVTRSVKTFGPERDALGLVSEEQHVAFIEPVPRNAPDRLVERGKPLILSLETSESSSLKNFSGHLPKTPYPSPAVLGELIMQQANEETDGSNDDSPKTDFSSRKVRVMSTSGSTLLPPPSSAVSKTSINPTIPSTCLLSRQKRKGNKFGNAFKRVFFKRPPNGNSRHSGQKVSLSGSSHTTFLVGMDNIPPTLPQGGIREISTSNNLLPLMIQGLDKDFLPSEATFVPTPPDTPILGAPLSFDEAICTIPATTEPSPASSDPDQPGVSLENTTSPELILTRPLLTQDKNIDAPFFKMGGSFPAPPTPPLPKVHCANDRQFEDTVKLPNLDTHGLIQEQFGHQKNAFRRVSVATAIVKAFFAKPFTKWERRDLVASITNETDKESPRVAIKDRYSRRTAKKNVATDDLARGGTGNRPSTSSPVPRFMRTVSFPAVRESLGPFTPPKDRKAEIEPIEHVTEEMNSAALRNTMVIDTKEGDWEIPHTTTGVCATGVSSDHNLTFSHHPDVCFPILDFCPSPPSPIQRPASTIPTTVKHERRYNSRSISSLPIFSVQAEVEKLAAPLPLLPLEEDGDDSIHHLSPDCGPTPPPSARTVFPTPTTATGSHCSSELLNRRWLRYTCNSEKGTFEEVAHKRSSIGSEVTSTSTAGGVPLQARSRGDSVASERSWESGGTILDMGETGRAMLGTGGPNVVTMKSIETGCKFGVQNLDISSHYGERIVSTGVDAAGKNCSVGSVGQVIGNEPKWWEYFPRDDDVD